ncbi:flagellar assembly peptidoglycan hydrolase FlgJ [Serratia liquefaciens]|jgi:peptidoglycan hydrolase FlgJ|uniref:Peptidoglycan hydrolase FlgJ n=1 Tax=Serratia liquefaciens TaxID=614 RepID=A0A515CTS5_SERLI|nr:flagellar assembly peptidoglycan hydrolase FlgJ [Serratia liquefaciens]MBV0842511.1 flagellar assembly peptidoglycan hydrolase FlgJ [Serratia liquefaciens]MCH4194941.1 flagellar assembly peptidoglycan hydrolase FlgJ [Serratia liquefaciens]MCH4233031.1 flagellar assembly peptidoglycan hydrolase FlgJ [Serratia liquefaciens]MCH4262669.1 flagellar assembly peptidoglycan hydrolase FlgJ [Serratia liquefaciens]MCI1215904.1 flagellar assembly peptidoglycan hydrolase FlgJ [Serratia liquefaciens]
MAGDLMAMSGAAYDAQALNGLKRDAASDPQGNLKQVAQQVEGMFVQMMLKSMRAALPQDGILSSDQSRLYTSMYDQQIAQQMSQKGLGLADMMVKQMSNANAVPSETAGTSPMALDDEVLRTLPNQALEQTLRRAVPKAPSAAPLSLNNGNFVARLSTPARVVSQQSGIPHQLIVAQAALESGWGQREIPAADGSPSYNLFGIKAGGSWDGPVTEITTTEFEQGAAKKIKAKFRVYGSYVEAMADYVKLLTNNPRYAGVANARSPEQAAQALQQAGYATDPQYASKLVSVIQQMKNAGEQVVKAYTHDLKDLF